MAVRLSKLASNPAARTDGDWVALGGDWDGIRIKTRKLTDQYQDAVAAKVRRLARGGLIADVGSEDVRRIRHECLTAYVWVDVEGVTDDTDQPMAAGPFFASLIEPGFEDLFEACAGAAIRVNALRAEDAKAALGN